jgi:hypothetical protein
MPRNGPRAVFTDVGFPASVSSFSNSERAFHQIDDHHRVREDLRTYEE